MDLLWLNTYFYVFEYGIRDPRFDILRIDIMRPDRNRPPSELEAVLGCVYRLRREPSVS